MVYICRNRAGHITLGVLTPNRVPLSARLSAIPFIKRATMAANMIGNMVGPKSLALLIVVPNFDIGLLSRLKAQTPRTG